jgi:hypothetical protein
MSTNPQTIDTHHQAMPDINPKVRNILQVPILTHDQEVRGPKAPNQPYKISQEDIALMHQRDQIDIERVQRQIDATMKAEHQFAASLTEAGPIIVQRQLAVEHQFVSSLAEAGPITVQRQLIAGYELPRPSVVPKVEMPPLKTVTSQSIMAPQVQIGDFYPAQYPCTVQRTTAGPNTVDPNTDIPPLFHINPGIGPDNPQQLSMVTTMDYTQLGSSALSFPPNYMPNSMPGGLPPITSFVTQSQPTTVPNLFNQPRTQALMPNFNATLPYTFPAPTQTVSSTAAPRFFVPPLVPPFVPLPVLQPTTTTAPLLAPTIVPTVAAIQPTVHLQENLNLQKLRAYDGKDNLQSYLLHFESCVEMNRWDERRQFLALKSALKDPASNVLWDGATKPNTAKDLVEALKARFGGGTILREL